MSRSRWIVFGGLLLLLAAALWLRGCPAHAVRLDALHVPPGFHIALYAAAVPGARALALGAQGTVFVGTRGVGRVYALVDRDGDQRADTVYTLARDLNSPNGVAFRDGALYVAETHRVVRFNGIEARLERPPAPVVITDRLPREGHHGWRYLGFGPDGWLYIGSGAPCNVCDAPDERFAVILRLRPDPGGLGPEIFARGVRNTVGFDWHPGTGELWFTDNGRDLLGPDRPPDELNRAPRPGLRFGFPFCHGRDIPDPEFAREGAAACAEFAPPEMAPRSQPGGVGTAGRCAGNAGWRPAGLG